MSGGSPKLQNQMCYSNINGFAMAVGDLPCHETPLSFYERYNRTIDLPYETLILVISGSTRRDTSNKLPNVHDTAQSGVIILISV